MEDCNIDNALLDSFDSRLRSQLTPVWASLSYETKQVRGRRTSLYLYINVRGQIPE
jgi:hypothetical protein